MKARGKCSVTWLMDGKELWDLLKGGYFLWGLKGLGASDGRPVLFSTKKVLFARGCRSDADTTTL